MNHLTENATYEDAERYGVPGRILWALANLGRTPKVQRVWEKANERIKPESRDKAPVFGAAVASLESQGLVRIVKPDRMELVFNSKQATMQVRCVTPSCGATAPVGFSREDALRQAELSGFVMRGDKAWCPLHVPAEGPAEPTQERRRDRRKRERQERKAGRRQVTPEPSTRVETAVL